MNRAPFYLERAYRNGNLRTIVGFDSPYPGGDMAICVENSFVLQTIDSSAVYQKAIMVISTDWGNEKTLGAQEFDLDGIAVRIKSFAENLEVTLRLRSH